MANSKIFRDYSFIIIESANLLESEASNIKNDLIENGVTNPSKNIIIKKSSDLFALPKDTVSSISYIIANDINFPEYQFANNNMLPVVKSSWVYASVKKGKMPTIKSYSPDPKYFFKSVQFVFDKTISSSDKLVLLSGIKAFGGQASDHVSTVTTYIVSNEAEDSEKNFLVQKYNKLPDREVTIKYIYPRWITDCLIAKQKLDTENYLLPISKNSRNGSVAGDLIENDDTPAVRKFIVPELDHFLKGKTFLLGDDLFLSDLTYSTLEKMITNYGGKIVKTTTPEELMNFDSAINCYVGCYREGFQYLAASRKKIDVGNLHWLFWMLSNSQWISPLDNLLHYPYPRGGIEGMQNAVICTTSYIGDARQFIYSLVTMLGAKITKSLTSKNTHLIVGNATGAKYEAAKKWKVNCVNHLWLEDCFRNWQKMDIGNLKYTTFKNNPVVGSTKLDIEVLSKFFDLPESRMLSLELAPSQESQSQANGNMQANSSPEPEHEYETKHEINPESSPVKNKKVKDDKDKENIQEEKNTEYYPVDEIQYKENQSEKGEDESVGGKRKHITPEPTTTNVLENSEVNSSIKKSVKKQKIGLTSSPIANLEKKKANNKPYSLVTVLTGCDSDFTKADLRILNRVGIKVIDHPTQEMNCIVAPSILRTEKFLKSLSMGPDYILTPLFIFDVLGTMDSYNNKITDFESYKPHVDNYSISNSIDFSKDSKIRDLFENPTLGEENIRLLIKNARSIKGSLFKDINFTISSKIPGGFKLISSIVGSFGGVNPQVFEKKTKKIDIVDDKVNYLLCSPDEDNLIESFKKIVSGNKFRVIEWNWVIRSIFNMKLIDDKYILDEAM